MFAFYLTNGKFFRLSDLNTLYDNKVVIKENILSITKSTKQDKKNDECNVILKNIDNEIEKRIQDVKLLEKSYEDLSNNIKDNFDLAQEQESSRELFTLLGL